MDRVMVELITSCREFRLFCNSPSSSCLTKILCWLENDPSSTPEASDYLGMLLRDPSSSHILEIITSRCPPSAFDKLWAIYFKGALLRLAVHPVANFVLAKALERVSKFQLLEVCAELRNTWHKLISTLRGRFTPKLNWSWWLGTSRTGVLRAAIDRAAVLQVLGEEIVEVSFFSLLSMLELII